MTGHFHNYDWLCHLATFINNDGTKRWPSDKANHSYVNYVLYCIMGYVNEVQIFTNAAPLLGLSLLCSENCLLSFLELLQFCVYYARFYTTSHSIMLTI